MTDTTTTTQPAKRERNGSVILTDRMCEKRVTSRAKIYDRKCPGLYVSITTAGVATFMIKLPDFALDMHTMKGKAMGRGLDHFRKEGAKLVPPPTGDDPYEDEAYRLWQIKQQGK